MSQCHTCIHRALRQIGGGTLWGCIARKIRFGADSEWYAGKNQPEKCAQYKK